MTVPTLLESDLLARIPGLTHGFSTRIGGVSEAPFLSLNLGFGLGDSDENVRENKRRLLSCLGVATVLEVTQVHGSDWVKASPDLNFSTQADAIFTSERGIGVAVRTADCAPILLCHAPGGVAKSVAAIHAGWRGAIQGVAGRFAEALQADPKDIFVAIGPTIGFDAFEVGPEVIQAAQAAVDFPLPFREGARDRFHLNLVELLKLQLTQLGVPPDQIDDVGGCTHTQPHHFFSHRRDQGRTGRQLSAIALTP